jgi:uncharacterized protein YndB with AHSA1/START domain
MTEGTYEATIRIEASPEEVFPYLTDPALLVAWMGDWAELEPHPGGRFVVDINGIPVRGRYVTVEPPKRLVLTWGTPGSEVIPPGSTTVEITLRVEGASTVLELIHSDLPPEQAEQHGIGWTHFLDRLSKAASGLDPGPDPWA